MLFTVNKKEKPIQVRVVATRPQHYEVEHYSYGLRDWIPAMAALFLSREAAVYHAYQFLGEKVKEKKHLEQGIVFSIDEDGYSGELHPGLYEKELEEAKSKWLSER
ncbi:hypothetical protein TY_16 [Pseudomonas phage vB_PaeM_Ty]|nr:hypothetical protein TY_16 [Pseudomonas phage vB_PaeM_Ty]